MYDATSQGLYQDQSVDCDSDTVVWISETPLRTDSKPAEYEDNSKQSYCQNLEPYVQTQCETWVPVVELCNENCRRHHKQECNSSKHTMAKDEFVILGQR